MLASAIIFFVHRLKTSEELVSHDIHNNKFQYKHSFSVEIIPISKVSAYICIYGIVFSETVHVIITYHLS